MTGFVAAFFLVTVLLFAVLAAVFCVLIVQKFFYERRGRRKESWKRAHRGAVVRNLIGGEAGCPVRAGAPGTAEREAFLELCLEFLDNLKGESAARITDWLEGAGLVAERAGRLAAADWPDRAVAALELGRMRSPTARAPLAALLCDPHPLVRISAARALARLGACDLLPEVLEALAGPLRFNRRLRFDLLYGFGREAGAQLLDALRRGRWPAEVMEILGELKDAAAAPLILPYLSDPDPQRRISAARALGTLGDSAALGGLGAALKDPEWQVRAQSARALGAIAAPAAAEGLEAALGDSVWAVRHEAAFALLRLSEGEDLLERFLAACPEESRLPAARLLAAHRRGVVPA